MFARGYGIGSGTASGDNGEHVLPVAERVRRNGYGGRQEAERVGERERAAKKAGGGFKP